MQQHLKNMHNNGAGSLDPGCSAVASAITDQDLEHPTKHFSPEPESGNNVNDLLLKNDCRLIEDNPMFDSRSLCASIWESAQFYLFHLYPWATTCFLFVVVLMFPYFTFVPFGKTPSGPNHIYYNVNYIFFGFEIPHFLGIEIVACSLVVTVTQQCTTLILTTQTLFSTSVVTGLIFVRLVWNFLFLSVGLFTPGTEIRH